MPLSTEEYKPHVEGTGPDLPVIIPKPDYDVCFKTEPGADAQKVIFFTQERSLTGNGSITVDNKGRVILHAKVDDNAVKAHKILTDISEVWLVIREGA